MADLGLYLHVPFCRRKCHWCAFASELGSRNSDRWLDRILGQLEHPPSPEARWATVYLGGGTPTLLSPSQLERLWSAVSVRLAPGAEVTMEANPESLTSDHLEVFGRIGTRLSLGVQSFQEELLARQGRPTTKAHLDAARRLIDRWPGQLSLDLICGLPGQSDQGQRDDWEEALSWGPDHLSWYSLTLEPGTPLARRAEQGTADLPDQSETEGWWFDGRDRFEQAGFVAYEVSNFAIPGAESIHNGRYWALEPWWGLGPSAHSYLPDEAGQMQQIFQPTSFEDWASGAPATVETPTALESVKDRLLAGLRRTTGVPVLPWIDLLPQTLGRWEGKAIQDSGRLFLSREAFPLLDSFLREAFIELDGRPEFR